MMIELRKVRVNCPMCYGLEQCESCQIEETLLRADEREKWAEEKALMEAVIEAARAHRDFARGQIDLTPTKMKEAIRLFDSLGHAIQALDNYHNTRKGGGTP
jgi:hypothetical protein